MASSGVVGGPLALALIAGVNLGAALPALFATSASSPSERRVAIGNLLFRGCGALLMLPFIASAQAAFDGLKLSAGASVALQHLIFNLLLAMAALPLIGLTARLLGHLIPEPLGRQSGGVMQPRGPRHLDDVAPLTPE